MLKLDKNGFVYTDVKDVIKEHNSGNDCNCFAGCLSSSGIFYGVINKTNQSEIEKRNNEIYSILFFSSLHLARTSYDNMKMEKNRFKSLSYEVEKERLRQLKVNSNEVSLVNDITQMETNLLDDTSYNQGQSQGHMKTFKLPGIKSDNEVPDNLNI